MPRVQVPLKKADARSRVEQTRPPIVRRHRNRDRVAPRRFGSASIHPVQTWLFFCGRTRPSPVTSAATNRCRGLALADASVPSSASPHARPFRETRSWRHIGHDRGGTRGCAPAKTDRLNITPLHSLPRASLQVTKARWQFNGPGLRASTYAVSSPPMACGAWATPWRSMASNDEWRCLYSPNEKRLRVSGRAWPRLG